MTRARRRAPTAQPTWLIERSDAERAEPVLRAGQAEHERVARAARAAAGHLRQARRRATNAAKPSTAR